MIQIHALDDVILNVSLRGTEKKNVETKTVKINE